MASPIRIAFASLAILGALALAGCGQPSQSQLTTGIAEAVRDLNQRVPMQVDPITTLTAVRANGTEIVYEMAVSQEIPGDVAAIRQTAQAGNQANLCADANAGRLIRMGASMRHQYTDPSGDSFETRVTGCPAAPAKP